MAQNILLNEKKERSAQVTNLINYFLQNFELSQQLQKHSFSFFKSKKEDEILKTLQQNLSKITELIHYLDSFNEVPLQIKDLNNNSLKDLKNKIIFQSSIQNTFFAKKEVIELVLLLLTLHQIDVKNKKNAVISFSLNENKLTLKTPPLPLNKREKEILFSSKSNLFIKEKNKIYGLYLNFLKKLKEKKLLEYEVKIENLHYYTITIFFEIKSVEDKKSNIESVLSIFSKKILLLSNSKYLKYKLQDFLQTYNFSIYAKENYEKLPPLMNYHIIMVDEELLTPSLEKVLIKAKSFDIKVVLLSQDKNTNSLLADSILLKSFKKEELITTLISLYSTKKLTSTKPKIIIADDDIINLRLLEYECKKLDLEVLTASNGKEVLKLLQTYGANLIILDSKMPYLDGYETAALIRKEKKYQSIPLIIHSAFTLMDKKREIFHYGFDAILPRPFKKEELEKIIKRYIKNSQEEVALKKKRQFFALYQDIDKVIEKYIEKNEKNKLLLLLTRLKNDLYSIEEFTLIKNIEMIEYFLKNREQIHKSIFGKFLQKLHNLLKRLKPLTL